MTLPVIPWSRLSTLDAIALKGEVFGILQQIAVAIHEADRDDPAILETVPRLTQLIADRPELVTYAEVLSSLARSVGLWNYIDTEIADHREETIALAVTVEKLGGITLHREQVAALNTLLSGRNLVLSAPTSFGKSLLVDALLLSGGYKRVAIVLPTIALLDEFRRRLQTRFGGEFDILMHHSEKATREKIVFLGTQERLINRKDLGTLDLVVVDEFYKLDPARQDERSVTLNAAVYQLLKKSRQFFFLGPNIENVRVSGNSPWRFEFLRTRFSTVAVDTFDLRDIVDKDQRLTDEAYKLENWPALVFVSSPDRANKMAAQLVDTDKAVGQGRELAAWINANFGGKWDISKSVAAGIGTHHGRIPRALASRFVKLFNERHLPILLCTSTLIEGVNTAAKSVLIYDKKIARKSYDFFTFSNIRGRAGRLGQHHIGKVFLFHVPPEREAVDVTPPLFGNLDDAPDELVVHVAPGDARPTVADRVEVLKRRLGLTTEEVQRLASLGIANVEAIKASVQASLSADTDLVWTGRPDYKQVRAVCEVICSVRPAREFGVVTANQLTKYLTELRKAPLLRAFFEWYAGGFRGATDKYDNVFKFLRACEYSLPEYFGCVELFVKKAGHNADYALFMDELPRWFRPEAVKALEEQGVPIQISEPFSVPNIGVAALTNSLRTAALNGSPRLTPLERQWVLDALP